MNDPTILAMLLFFSIPTLAILSRFVIRWRALGTSNRKLEQQVERLEKVNAEYAERLENLEAIMASRAWNALDAPGPIPTAPHEAEEMTTRRVA
ncbi:MAG TPA: hypothetical protein VFR31_19870, partial [Thermoanaerobaculia bacterium]|nr:hypothetical protein [Thermoanaerobaculia bacterium]